MYLLIFIRTYYVLVSRVYSDDTNNDDQKVKELHRKSGVKGIIHTLSMEKKILRADRNIRGE